MIHVPEDRATTTDVSEADLPRAITRYIVAHDARETEAAMASFAPNASVADAGSVHTTPSAIRHWLDHEASEYTYTATTVRRQRLDERHYVVTRHLEGDFPGGVVDLRYSFELSDGRITGLVIAP
jgi:hypothetical protein